MKKYFLSLLIVPLLLIGGYSFAGYENITTCLSVSSETVGTTQYINCKLPLDFENLQINNNNYWIKYKSVGQSYYNSFIMDRPFNGTLEDLENYFQTQFTELLIRTQLPIEPSFSYTIFVPLVEGGTANFTPVITGLTGSINEFIPYVVYIGLGVLGVLISFVAIKRLLNWIRVKIFSSFK